MYGFIIPAAQGVALGGVECNPTVPRRAYVYSKGPGVLVHQIYSLTYDIELKSVTTSEAQIAGFDCRREVILEPSSSDILGEEVHATICSYIKRDSRIR